MALNDELPEEVEALRRVPFFEGLTPEDLERIARIGQRRRFDAAEHIVEKGRAGATLFVILSGRAEVEAGGRVHELGPGDFVGEMALLSRRPRSATVTATEPVETLAIEAMYFQPFLIKNPSVAVAILEGVVERLREAQEALASARGGTAE